MGSVIYKEQFANYEQLVAKSMVLASKDIADDVVGAAQGAAPHLRGQLEKGITKEMSISTSGIEITVDASAKDKKGFDYAPYIHDSDYNLGTISLSKGGGKSGLSGKTFNVGKGFIERPVEQGEAAYISHFEKALRGVKI